MYIIELGTELPAGYVAESTKTKKAGEEIPVVFRWIRINRRRTDVCAIARTVPNGNTLEIARHTGKRSGPAAAATAASEPETEVLVADAGYHSKENVERCVEQDIEPSSIQGSIKDEDSYAPCAGLTAAAGEHRRVRIR